MKIAFAALKLRENPQLRQAAFNQESVYLVSLIQGRMALGSIDYVGETLVMILEWGEFFYDSVSFALYTHRI